MKPPSPAISSDEDVELDVSGPAHDLTGDVDYHGHGYEDDF